jgi:beta-galactosidase
MARTVTSLNKNWYFTKEQIAPAAPDFSKMEPVTLPHTWNDLDGQDGGFDYYRGLCWYP